MKLIEKLDKLGFDTYERGVLSAVMDAMEDKEKTRLLASITHIAQSGMSRHISFGLIYENEFINLNWYIKQLLGLRWNKRKDALVVSGCGQDMIFHVLDCLAHALDVKNYHQAYRLI